MLSSYLPRKLYFKDKKPCQGKNLNTVLGNKMKPYIGLQFKPKISYARLPKILPQKTSRPIDSR